MKVTTIGTGCTWFKRQNTCFLIDDNIVFDTPSGTYKDVIKNVEIEKISTILISHFHSDHFGDFHVFAARFMRELKNLESKKQVYAPKGCLERLLKINEAMIASNDELIAENFEKNIDFIDLYDGFEFVVGEYKVTSYKMEHGKPETYGFVFENKNGLKVGFSADTQMCDNLHKILKTSNYAFVEMASTTKRDNHLCIDEIEELIKMYPNCKVHLVHTCDKCQDYAKNNNMNFLEDGQILNFNE